MLSLNISDASLYENMNLEDMDPDEKLVGAFYLLNTHILPGLGINEESINEDSYIILKWMLSECIANSNQACIERFLKQPSNDYAPSILLRCKKTSESIIFYLRDNGIGSNAGGTEFKRTKMNFPNKGVCEKIIKKLPTNYRRVSGENGSTIRWGYSTQSQISIDDEVFSLLKER